MPRDRWTDEKDNAKCYDAEQSAQGVKTEPPGQRKIPLSATMLSSLHRELKRNPQGRGRYR